VDEPAQSPPTPSAGFFARADALYRRRDSTQPARRRDNPPMSAWRSGAAALAAATGLGLADGAARAQAAPAMRLPPAHAAPPDFGPLASRFDAFQARRAAGVADTAFDRSLAGRGAASVGFLCGLQPGPDVGGGAAAFGADPHGRFVGAQLRLSFR
jgi:hypothetical protein